MAMHVAYDLEFKLLKARIDRISLPFPCAPSCDYLVEFMIGSVNLRGFDRYLLEWRIILLIAPSILDTL